MSVISRLPQGGGGVSVTIDGEKFTEKELNLERDCISKTFSSGEAGSINYHHRRSYACFLDDDNILYYCATYSEIISSEGNFYFFIKDLNKSGYTVMLSLPYSSNPSAIHKINGDIYLFFGFVVYKYDKSSQTFTQVTTSGLTYLEFRQQNSTINDDGSIVYIHGYANAGSGSSWSLISFDGTTYTILGNVNNYASANIIYNDGFIYLVDRNTSNVAYYNTKNRNFTETQIGYKVNNRGMKGGFFKYYNRIYGMHLNDQIPTYFWMVSEGYYISFSKLDVSSKTFSETNEIDKLIPSNYDSNLSSNILINYSSNNSLIAYIKCKYSNNVYSYAPNETKSIVYREKVN